MEGVVKIVVVLVVLLFLCGFISALMFMSYLVAMN